MITSNRRKVILRMFVLSMLFVLLCNCGEDKSISQKSVIEESKNIVQDPIDRDLDAIKKQGKLKVLLAYSGTSYFLYKGKPMGYEYELLQGLADYLELELEIIVSKNLDMLLTNLARGDADIVAYGLAITNDRKRVAAFTDYLYLTKQVLVQQKPLNWRKMTLDNIKENIIQDPLQLIGDTVSVRKNTSYYERLKNLSQEIGGKIIIDTLEGSLSTQEIIEMVANNKIKYTIADNNLADINSSYFPILDFEVPVSFSQRIAWAVRPKSLELLKVINTWIKQYKKDPEFNMLYNKYFKNRRNYNTRLKSELYTMNSQEISLYDKIIQTNAKQIGWDWRLLAALIYQESRFKNEASAWTGATGLMQMMPGTAKDMGVKDRLDPEDNIRGGTKYLKTIHDAFADVSDSIQRIKFTLASYNCGYFHVKDAQTLAKLKGLNPKIWDENVDQMILALTYPKNFNREEIKYGYVRGQEPYNYVNDIFARNDHYLRFVAE